ncbi:hypothetical protein TVAG_065830 [Trichomonas vaginalis G3]|uniref:Uncharacterized protein n=1 Tax=Trichomonas vaginalis (strain ATCC PRA-98 / G3) TaxID=412133 RepID=A2ELY7_TRIV3|nr:syndetin family [Trichomonas vaginalis G3]EAY06326.1 hypothetical protein TVAG_065830 [Trichomonas vaginalis G3]KAI5489862.1 syndetin family [Trichomonas vaginalis G3]|eukprot:XP_001318549.1 hypothetical protein [Trichomonas vaginalis G3]
MEQKSDNEINTLEEVPRIFFDSSTPDDCVLSILSGLPPVFDEKFGEALDKQIKIAESSIGIVSEELTKHVYASQDSIFDATSRFLKLQEQVENSTRYISSIRSEITSVRENTLDPMINVYTHIRNLKRYNKNSKVVHFTKCLLLIDEILHSRQFITASYNYECIKNILNQDDLSYSPEIYDKFYAIGFPDFPTDVCGESDPLKIGELKKIGCISEILESIQQFPSNLETILTKELQELSETFDEQKYSEVIASYLFISESPPIAKMLVNIYTKLLHDRAYAYFEASSNDIDTLFRFMDTNCALLKKFQTFIQFHSDNSQITDIIDKINPDYIIPKIDGERFDNILSSILTGFHDNFNHFYSAAESSVLQFLSRINCKSLDALSFIKLVRGLKEFTSILTCEGIQDWLQITSSEYLQRYTSACIMSTRQAIASDSWAPVPIESDFLQHVQTVPCDEQIFEFPTDEEPTKRYTCSSAMQCVRIIHSLVCLSVELNKESCISLIINVSSTYVAGIINTFCSPYPLLTVSDGSVSFSQKLTRSFQNSFVENLKTTLRLIGHLSLTEQRPVESAESHLMQMIVGTEGLKLLSWYLKGIKNYLNTIENEKVTKFYDITVFQLLKQCRPNISAFCARNFMNIKQLKYQIIAADWNVQEITIEYHGFVSILKKSLENLSKTLLSFQLPRDVSDDIWRGTWMRICNVLIHAFGSVRVCNSNGRSLMIGDTRAAATIFTNMTKLTDIDYVDVLDYINAFFFNLTEFSSWLEKASLRYKSSYLVNLIRTGLSCKLSSKDMRDLLSKVETPPK